MEIFLVTFIVMAIAVAGMAIGVICGREPIKGSCGGLNKLQGLECECAEPCEKKRRAQAAASEQQTIIWR